nr:TonB-dependent siderophore receptor [uncultured Tolumonas sp.]
MKSMPREFCLSVLCSSLIAVGLPATAADETAMKALPTVQVTGQAKKLANSGKASQGYCVTNANVGPLGNKKVLDLPYSVQSVSSDFIKNQQVDSTPDLLKYTPSAQVEYRGGGEIGRPQTRGFQADLLQNTRIDGYSVGAHFPQPVELYERQDVLYGLAGAFYGPSNAAGIFNSVLKRPTDTPVRRVSQSYEGSSQYVSRGDFGGRAGDNDKYGYRLNVMHGDGERYVENSNLRRELVGLAVDSKVSDKTLIEANVSHYVYDQTGYPGSFGLSTTATSLPSAADAKKAGYGQSFATSEVTSDIYGARVTHQLNDDWKISGGLQEQDVLRSIHGASNKNFGSDGSFTVTTSESYTKQELLSNQLYLNGKAKTGQFKHDLVIGTNGYRNPSYQAKNSAVAASTCKGSIDNPCFISNEPAWNGYGSFDKTGDTTYQTLIFGDTMAINDRWSVMGVASNGWININSSSASSNSDNGGAAQTVNYAPSYTTALIYKPRKNMTTYINYADSVQPGGTAPTTANNANATLDPYHTKQIEAGYKANVANMEFTTAAFRIERPLAYTGSDNIYREQGQQVNHGLEFYSRGRATENTTVMGGMTWLDPKLKDTLLASTDDKQVIGVPKWQANMLTEYDLPQVNGLTLTGNLHYTGKRAANNTNTAWADGYTTADIGTRFTKKIGNNKTLTWRLGVNNVTDKQYWASLMPGNTEGNTVAASSAYLGEPRTFKTSLQLDF